MTANELAIIELEKENVTTTPKLKTDLEVNVVKHKDSSMLNTHITDTTVPREIESQYEAFLEDPRRI